ncbi:MAG TPA: hypothetical protein VLK30_08945 [Candidatus Limnocylindrales bacterium]|nr:hypothetical protein [Candidatus Limnocylindrales bacterium]
MIATLCRLMDNPGELPLLPVDQGPEGNWIEIIGLLDCCNRGG